MESANDKIAPGAGNAEGRNANAAKHIAAPNQTTAADARDAALDRIARRADPGWLAAAEAALLAAIDRHGAATVDAARADVPPPDSPKWWCLVPRGLCARGLIRRVGTRTGIAPVTHAGDLREWARAEALP